MKSWPIVWVDYIKPPAHPPPHPHHFKKNFTTKFVRFFQTIVISLRCILSLFDTSSRSLSIVTLYYGFAFRYWSNSLPRHLISIAKTFTGSCVSVSTFYPRSLGKTLQAAYFKASNDFESQISLQFILHSAVAVYSKLGLQKSQQTSLLRWFYE